MSREVVLGYFWAGIGLFQGVVYLKYAISARSRIPRDETNRSRIERADDNRERVSPEARYVVSAVGFGMAILLLAHLITPAVAYALMCLSLAGRCVTDQVVEERTPRRRSALIGRPRSVDPVLAIWIALTGAAAFGLIPWLFDQPYRTAAVIVAMCVAIMVAVAWRVASAPPLLFGNDLEAEQIVDRETRVLRTGNACIVTIGCVAVFNAFAGGQSNFSDRGFLFWGLMILWIALLAWRTLYARRLTRTPLAP